VTRAPIPVRADPVESHRPDTSVSRRLRLGLAGVCSILLVVSCGSAEQSAGADEPSTPGSTRSSAPAIAAVGSDVALVDLGDAAAVAAWTTVNDPVMGGRSTSTVTFGDGGLVFSGNLSLENNGGFASARGPEDPEIGSKATGSTSLRVRALGDGKTYLVKAGIAGQPWSYVQRFPTEAGVQRDYVLPVEGFEPVGMRLDPDPDAPRRLDPSGIDQLSVYVLDKQQGPFAVTVRAIDATF
jgi:hypothetical protein